jgi:hypothetical protein
MRLKLCAIPYAGIQERKKQEERVLWRFNLISFWFIWGNGKIQLVVGGLLIRRRGLLIPICPCSTGSKTFVLLYRRLVIIFSISRFFIIDILVFFCIETVISLFKSLSCESLLPMTIELSCITYSGFIQIIKEIITFLLEIKSSLSTRIKHEIELKYLQNRLSFYIFKWNIL